MTNTLSFAGLGVAVFAFISEIISVALEYWIYMDESGLVAYAGLWKSCSEFMDVKTCSSDGSTDDLRAVQFMVLFGMFSTLVSVVCGTLKLFVLKENRHLLFAVTALMTAAGIFQMIGMSVYVSEIYNPRKDTFDLHAGFAFCVVAWIASWTSAVLFGLGLAKEK